MKEIPTLQNPCMLCRGIGQTPSMIQGQGVTPCLRCEGTGEEPTDIKEREVVIVIRSFFSYTMKEWISSIEVETKRKDIRPVDIASVLNGLAGIIAENKLTILKNERLM